MTPTKTPQPISRERILGLFAKFPAVRVAVIGDVMLDRYLIGDAERLSPEAPVPVVTVREHRAALGGAGNVAANVAAMGAACHLVGVVGDDGHARTIRTELLAAGLGDEHLLTIPGRPTTSKSRLVARGQQVVRIDEEVDTPIEGADRTRLREVALARVEEADVLLLQDYNKGVLCRELIAELIAAARKRAVPIIVDPKYRHFFDFAGATVFKPNRRELETALGAAVDLAHWDSLPAALQRLQVDNLLVTLGADGMALVATDGSVTHFAGVTRPVYDVSGAGDTVTAWLGTALAAGATLQEAAILGNYAAAIEVGKPLVATVTPGEVLQLHEEQHDQIGRLRRGGVI
ncbi:MAG: PfkB family carbohydrate kinase [Gemmatimonadota bacterium]|nr:PfkB family carbohydrate kinase [Gemmatimonadota bacterium]